MRRSASTSEMNTRLSRSRASSAFQAWMRSASIVRSGHVVQSHRLLERVPCLRGDSRTWFCGDDGFPVPGSRRKVTTTDREPRRGHQPLGTWLELQRLTKAAVGFVEPVEADQGQSRQRVRLGDARRLTNGAIRGADYIGKPALAGCLTSVGEVDEGVLLQHRWRRVDQCQDTGRKETIEDSCRVKLALPH